MPEEILDNQKDEEVVDDVLTDGESDLIAAIQKLNQDNPSDEESDDDADDDVDTDETDSDDDSDADDDSQDDSETDDDDTVTDDTTKKKQSKEENAKFAKERREREFQARLQAEITKLKESSPEFQLAKQLHEMTGKPIDQIQAEMREAALVEQAKKQQVPVEMLRKQQEAEQRANDLERKVNQLQFEQWNSKINDDGLKLQKEYSFLTQEDLDAAKSYILNVAKNVQMPLEDAVYAIHGKKIVENIAKGKVQDELASQSGRKKKTPLAPNNGKNSKSTNVLTADEKAVAKAFGMTEEEYAKYK